MKEICKWYKTAQCGASFLWWRRQWGEMMQGEKAHGAEGCYSGISEQTVQHKDTRHTGIKRSRREKGGKELDRHQGRTQITWLEV